VERFTRMSTSYTAACEPWGQSNASITWTGNLGAGGGGGTVGALVAGRAVGTTRWVVVGDAAEVGDASGVGVSSGVAVTRGVKVARGARVGVAVPDSRRAVKVLASQASSAKTTMNNTLKINMRFRSNGQLLSERRESLYSGHWFLANESEGGNWGLDVGCRKLDNCFPISNFPFPNSGEGIALSRNLC